MAGLALTLALSGVASAQVTMVRPDYQGGYNIYGPNGLTMVKPDYQGGYNVYGPNGFTMVKPDYVGGFNIYGPPPPVQIPLPQPVAPTWQTPCFTGNC